MCGVINGQRCTIVEAVTVSRIWSRASPVRVDIHLSERGAAFGWSWRILFLFLDEAQKSTATCLVLVFGQQAVILIQVAVQEGALFPGKHG